MSAYLVGAAFFILFWALLYAASPRLRPEMLSASLGLGHFGPILQHCYLQDYWSPEYLLAARVGGFTIGLEDYLFGFAVLGLAAGLFGSTEPTGRESVRPSSLETWCRLQIAGGTFVALTYVFAATGINSVHVTNSLCLIGTAVIIVARPRWLVRSLASGCLVALLLFAFYEAFYLPLYPTIIDDWWHASALTGIRLGRVPVEEVAWGFAMGVFIGPVVGICRSGAAMSGIGAGLRRVGGMSRLGRARRIRTNSMIGE